MEERVQLVANDETQFFAGCPADKDYEKRCKNIGKTVIQVRSKPS